MQQLFQNALDFVINTVLKEYIIGAVVSCISYVSVNFLGPIINAVLPSWFTTAIPNAFANASPTFWYTWNYFQFGNGMVIIFGAYLARFLIRRIPIIG